MDEEKRKQMQQEIVSVFSRHDVNNLIEIVGLLEITKELAILSGSSEGLGKLLEKQALTKAGLKVS